MGSEGSAIARGNGGSVHPGYLNPPALVIPAKMKPAPSVGRERVGVVQAGRLRVVVEVPGLAGAERPAVVAGDQLGNPAFDLGERVGHAVEGRIGVPAAS